MRAKDLTPLPSLEVTLLNFAYALIDRVSCKWQCTLQLMRICSLLVTPKSFKNHHWFPENFVLLVECSQQDSFLHPLQKH